MKNSIFWCWIAGACLCAAPNFGQDIPPHHNTDQLASGPSLQEKVMNKLRRLALHAEIPRELQVTLLRGIQSWSEGNPRALFKIDALLEAEESRVEKSDSYARQTDQIALLRGTLRQLSDRGGDLKTREIAKGATGGIQGFVTDARSGLPLDVEFVEVYNALGDFVDQDLTDDGEYFVGGLLPGTYFVLTDTEDHLDELYDDIPCPKGACNVINGTPVQVTQEGNTMGVDFELSNGGRILGTVTDAASGLPLRSEFVEVFDALGDRVGLDLTDGDGSFLVGGLPTGTYFVLADADDHLDELYDDIPCPLEICDVTDGIPVAVTLGSDTVGIDIALDTGGRVRGNLSEQLTGLPLDFEGVDLYNALGDRVGSGLTDSGGNYLVGGLPSGTYFAGTDTFGDFFDELYDDIPCPDQLCDPSSGTPISIDGINDTTGIDFVLSSSGPSEIPRLTERSGLILPLLVDLNNPEGRTTFFAVHNTSESSLAVEINYFTATVGDEPIRTDEVMLEPKSTMNVNVRNNLAGYDISGLDQLLGLVLITEQGGTTAPSLVGDSFSVDSSNNFASGAKLLRASALCNRQRIRFVDFGSGTELQVLLNEPRGAGTPSFSYTAYNESGAVVGSGDFFTEKHLVLIDRAELASASFGVLDIDFGNALGGHLSATYSAFGRFSVGVGGECHK